MKRLWHNFLNILSQGGRTFGRELNYIFHDPGVLLFFLFLPLAYPVIYSLIYNPELVRDVPVVVVDSDRSQLSRQFTRRLNATEGARIIGYAPTLSEARQAVNSGDAFAILEIPAGFDRKIGRGEQAPAILYCEMSLLLRYRALLFSATDLQQAMGAELLASDIASLGAESIAADSDPMPIHGIMLGNIRSGFDSYIMPGVIILILQQSIILAVGMIGGAAREKSGILKHSPSSRAPFSLSDMIAKAAAYITILLLPVIWLIHFVPTIFQFPMAGDPLQIFIFIIPMVIASIGLGFCIQRLCTERESIFVIWVATSIIFLFLSGLTWPRYAMSPLWQAISDLIPATWGINGYVLMNTNGATLSHVLLQWKGLWILALLYWLLAYLLPRLSRRLKIKTRL